VDFEVVWSENLLGFELGNDVNGGGEEEEEEEQQRERRERESGGSRVGEGERRDTRKSPSCPSLLSFIYLVQAVQESMALV